ncbi:hypothetical protein KY362_03600 [Candidatus Woesearchaeota archaeon]|nr:hypothetical protein [Candidatus Woesearchaeota archaeon]
MILKYTDLHNKILRDAADPDKVAEELLANGYYVVGVNVHNEGDEVKNKEHFYKFFETHFERFADRGLLMLPAVEIKIRDENYEALPGYVQEFSKRFIPVHHRGEVHHVPFMVFAHGGKKEVDMISVCMDHLDLLCHPKKGEGYFTLDLAKTAAEHDVGIEINYREYLKSADKDAHLAEAKELLSICHEAGNKIFLFSATIREEELVGVRGLIEYAKKLHEDLVGESMKNVHDLMQKKYGKLMERTGYSLEEMKKRHGI